MNRWLLGGVSFLLVGLTLLSAQAFAQSPTNIKLAAGYAKGNDRFDIVVKDAPGTKLELYVNDKNPTKATVNKHDWATFHRVKLVGSGKISFTKVLKGGSHGTYQKPINYTQRFDIVSSKVQFSPINVARAPVVAEPAPAPAPTPTPVPAVQQPIVATPAPVPPPPAPDCTNGSYVNSDGNTVCSPEASSTVPAGATAQCTDGTYSFSQHRSGTCSGHGGVAQWL